MIEVGVLVQQRLGGEGVDDAAVDVEMALDAHGLDEQWQGDRDPDELPRSPHEV